MLVDLCACPSFRFPFLQFKNPSVVKNQGVDNNHVWRDALEFTKDLVCKTQVMVAVMGVVDLIIDWKIVWGVSKSSYLWCRRPLQQVV